MSVYELLTFELPWQRGTGDGMAAMAHDSRPNAIEHWRPKVQPVLAKAVMECLARDREQRPETLERFLQSIHRLKDVDVQ